MSQSSLVVLNQSVTDSECIKAAQAVEQLDCELDELARELAKYESSCSSVTEPAKPYRQVDFESLTAWLDGLSESLPCSQTAAPETLPVGFNNLLDKPIQVLDESTMTSESFHLACGKPSFVNTTSSQPTSTSSVSCTTPIRPPAAASTAAPKADRKPYSRKTGKRQYSRWSMSHLQEEFLARFKPASQKRTLDRQFMIDALIHLDADEALDKTRRHPSVQPWATLFE